VRRGRLIACVCLLGIFAAALLTSLDYSLMDALGPGPGFFPFWLSLFGAALTLPWCAGVSGCRKHAGLVRRLQPIPKRGERTASWSCSLPADAGS
jgi:hypothetical protein